ncbi:MAG: serine protease [Pseudomonadota bacterium]
MSTPMQWHEAVKLVQPYLYRITTPTASGTGFLVAHSEAGDIFGIATAAHVIAHAHEWEQPIRLEHFMSGETFTVRPDKRVIFLDAKLDTAAVLFEPGQSALPSQPPKLIEEGKTIKTGVEIGWLGFPAVSPQNLCFFSGRVSSAIESESAYLVDGVAINGVSGGPTLWLGYEEVMYIGVLSAYIPNRATGEPLPGLAVVREVTQFHDLTKRFKSLDEARRAQAEAEVAAAAETEQRNAGISQ